jgi:hypothetical protein
MTFGRIGRFGRGRQPGVPVFIEEAHHLPRLTGIMGIMSTGAMLSVPALPGRPSVWRGPATPGEYG